MQGAREYALLFKTGQYGQLYIVSSSHARGRTFRIYVLPRGVVGRPNHNNPPINDDAVEVYGVVDGDLGWTESYGWIHEGPWQADFDALVAAAMQDRAKRDADNATAKESRLAKEAARRAALLASY